LSCQNTYVTVEIDITDYPCSYILEKDYIDKYPLEEVMAAVAYHECFNLSRLERWLVMEAFYNRIIHNFNNNGRTLKEQILAPKQFTGLWKFYPQQFKYDSNDTLCIYSANAYPLLRAFLRYTQTHLTLY